MRRGLLQPILRAPLILAKRLLVNGKDVRDISDLTEDTSPDRSADFVLTYDTSASLPKKVKPRNLGPVVLDKTGAQVSVNNTVTETSLYSVSVPAGIMGANGALRLTMFGYYINNSGAARTVRMRAKFGGATFYDDVSASIAASAVTRLWRLELLIANRNDAGIQEAVGTWAIGNVAAVTAGLGDLATDALSRALFGDDGSTISTSSAQTLQITAEHSIADADLTIIKNFAMVEVL